MDFSIADYSHSNDTANTSYPASANGKPEPDEISITEDISDNYDRKHRTVEGAGPQGGKHRTIE